MSSSNIHRRLSFGSSVDLRNSIFDTNLTDARSSKMNHNGAVLTPLGSPKRSILVRAVFSVILFPDLAMCLLSSYIRT